MSNMVVSADLVLKLDRLKEVTEHIRDLTNLKKNLSNEVLAALGMDEAPIGTTTFSDADGAVAVKVVRREELAIDQEAMLAALPALMEAKILGGVVTYAFKVDKKAYDKLPAADKALLKDAVRAEKKNLSLDF